MHIQRIIKSAVIICILIALAARLTWTVFTAQGQIASATFSTGRAELYLLKDLVKGTQADNLTHVLAGTNYGGIVPGWTTQQPLKLYNSGSVTLGLLFSAIQLAQPPDILHLANFVEVQVNDWTDQNQNGVAEDNEIGATISDWQALSTWVEQPIDVGVLPSSQTKALVVKFRVGDLDSSMAGASVVFNFNFDATAPVGGAH